MLAPTLFVYPVRNRHLLRSTGLAFLHVLAIHSHRERHVYHVILIVRHVLEVALGSAHPVLLHVRLFRMVAA